MARECVMVRRNPTRPRANRAWGSPQLAYVEARLLVEYDGRQHAHSTHQWNRDLDRHDALTAAGWICVRVTAARLIRPREVVDFVHRRLLQARWQVAPPVSGPVWRRLFEALPVAERGRRNDHRDVWA
jgi:hypothetical protein